jgi:hypothetical protein
MPEVAGISANQPSSCFYQPSRITAYKPRSSFFKDAFDVKYSVFHSSSIPCSLKPENTWIIDTGASDHMISCVSLFITITTLVSTSVELPLYLSHT